MTEPARDEVIQKLEQEAVDLLVMLKESAPARPLIIEFSGTPKAGKTTIINSLRLFLRRNGYQVLVLVERASTCPIMNKEDLTFNTWTACATLLQMLDAVQWPRRHQVVILDRGLFDALAWMDWLYNRKRMSAEDKQVVEKFLTLERWRTLIDQVIIMRTTPEESLKREYKDQVTLKRGTIMNEDAIADFNRSLETVQKNSSGVFGPVSLVDSTSVDPLETGKQDVELTLKRIQELVTK